MMSVDAARHSLSSAKPHMASVRCVCETLCLAVNEDKAKESARKGMRRLLTGALSLGAFNHLLHLLTRPGAPASLRAPQALRRRAGGAGTCASQALQGSVRDFSQEHVLSRLYK